jgi:hypothetical protein
MMRVPRELKHTHIQVEHGDEEHRDGEHGDGEYAKKESICRKESMQKRRAYVERRACRKESMVMNGVKEEGAHWYTHLDSLTLLS